MDLFFWFCVSFHQVWALCVSLIYVWKFFFTISAVTCAPKWVCECICRPIVARSEWMLLQQVCLHFKFLYYFLSLKHQYTLKKKIIPWTQLFLSMLYFLSQYLVLSAVFPVGMRWFWFLPDFLCWQRLCVIRNYTHGHTHIHTQETDLLLWCTTVANFLSRSSGTFQETTSQKCHLSLRHTLVHRSPLPDRHMIRLINI